MAIDDISKMAYPDVIAQWDRALESVIPTPSKPKKVDPDALYEQTRSSAQAQYQATIDNARGQLTDGQWNESQFEQQREYAEMAYQAQVRPAQQQLDQYFASHPPSTDGT